MVLILGFYKYAAPDGAENRRCQMQLGLDERGKGTADVIFLDKIFTRRKFKIVKQNKIWPVLRDVIIVTVLSCLSGFIVGFASTSGHNSPLYIYSLAISNSLFLTIGFTISGCLAVENRWRHLAFVAAIVWVVSIFNVIFFGLTFIQWAASVVAIAIFALIGGGISLLFKRKTLVEISSNASDEKFYEEVARELQGKTMVPGLWTKAFAEMGGDDAKARALYIKYRVAQLAEAGLQELEKERIAKQQQGKPKRVKNIKIVFAAVFVLAVVIAVICNTTPEKIDDVTQQKRSAEKGDADAAYYLGLQYLTGINTTHGVPKDYSEAFKWFSKAADLNHPDGQYYVGCCYYSGKGVEKNYTEAVKWFRKSADQNDLDAQDELGRCYDRGFGVPKDEAEAVKWYLKAAQQGNSTAQWDLGFCYAIGNGVAKDDAEAARWYLKSANQGSGAGQLELGECYARGKGVETNLVVAVKWFLLAATDDAFSAKRRIAEIESQMTPEQIAEAQKLSAAFVPRKQK